MSRLVCFIGDDGQTATCIAEGDAIDCETCPHNDDAHKKFVAENKETDLQKSIRKHEVQFNLNFIDDDVIIYGTASKDEGVQVFATTRCFIDERDCDVECKKCPYTDQDKEQALFDKYEEAVVEILRDAYKKIEALRVTE